MRDDTASLDAAYRSASQLLTFLLSPQGAIAFGMHPLLAGDIATEMDAILWHVKALYLRNSRQVPPVDMT